MFRSLRYSIVAFIVIAVLATTALPLQGNALTRAGGKPVPATQNSNTQDQNQTLAGGYRTAKYDDWATSADVKGNRVAVKRKNDKVFFKVAITVATGSNILLLDFGMDAVGAVTRGVAKTETLATFNGKKLKDTLETVSGGETIQIDGIGKMGKLMKLKYQWGKAKAVTLKLPGDYMLNKVGLPMPTLHNVGEELFPKGFGQTTPYFATGMLIGVPQGTKKARSILFTKYADVLASMVKKGKSGLILHTGTERCLDSLGKKVFDKQQKTYPPDKYSNKLFAQALALKLNIAASATAKFPTGLGTQVYDMGGSPFDEKTVAEISLLGDTIISCLTPTSIPAATLTELHDVMKYINEAFDVTPYTIDTLSFASKTQLTALALADANLTPGTGAQERFTDDNEAGSVVPEAFALHQNYPNPFNPTTKMSFAISQQSRVNLKVFNLLGQEVASIVNNEAMEEGEYEVDFNATSLQSGIYFYRLTTDYTDEAGVNKTFSDVKRMVLIK